MDKKLDRISVITTFYNAEKFILQAINSVNSQKVDGFELEYIIIDDKSEDKSRKLVEDFINKKGNKNIDIKIVTPDKNLGCGGARKFGIDNSTGNYLMFLDADDYYINSDFVYRAYNDITKENADIIEYGVLFNQPNGQQINNTAPQKIVLENYHLAELALFRDNLIKFNVWSKIYTRDIVNTKEYSTERTYEDVRTTPIWIANAKKIVIMPTAEINYRAAEGSIIREDQIKTRLGTITAIAELFDNPKFNCDLNIMKSMYGRAMVDLEAVLHNHSHLDAGFIEMARLNKKMLKYIYPDNYQDYTYDYDDLEKDLAKQKAEEESKKNEKNEE